MILFLDTTADLFVGLIDSNDQWIDKVRLKDKKITQNIHGIIYNLLKKNNSDISDLKRLIYCAGPGSYTGMRVSAGLSDILEWNGLERSSFYHFEIPKLCGVDQGQWVADAYKNEFFIYKWDKENEERLLVSKSDFKEQNDFYNHEKTMELIEENLPVILKNLNKQNKELFYYRELASEFTKC